MSWSQRAFQWLTRAYPRSTRDAFGEDMARLFDDLLRDAGHSPARHLELWLRVLGDTAVAAPRARVADRRARRLAGGPTTVEARRPVAKGDIGAALAALLPIVLLWLAAPRSFGPAFDDRVSILGVPVGAVITVPLVTLAAAMGFGARRARRTWVRAVFVLWAAIALALMILTPAFVLILINLKA